MIAGDRCVSEHIAKQNSTPVRKPRCHSRPRLKHSRAGYSGNPYGTSLHGELASLEAGYPAYAQWIPAFAGMTSGWGCRSREGGNPYGACSIEERLGFGAGYPDYAQWIPAFAGMTGWGAGPGWPTAIGPPRATSGIDRLTLSTGMPVKAIFMRLPGHAPPRRRLAAVPGNAKNVRWIKRGITTTAARGWPRATSSIKTNAATSSIKTNAATSSIKTWPWP